MQTKKLEQGSVVVWIMALCAIAMLAIMGLTKVGATQIKKAQLQNSADAAALSAAYELSNYRYSQACKSAKDSVSKNVGELTSCKTSFDEVQVTVISKENPNIEVKAKAQVE